MSSTISPSNVLFIICDEMSRQFLRCYGNTHTQTPNIDRLVREGTCFTQAYRHRPSAYRAAAARLMPCTCAVRTTM